MHAGILSAFLLVSSSLLFSTVVCDPSHHHNHNNDFPWQYILSSLGIVVQNQTSVISITELSGEATDGGKEHYTSESTPEILTSETKEGAEIPVIVQNGTGIRVTSGYEDNRGLGVGYKVGIPIGSILFFILFWYCICKCCCDCCKKERPGVIVMQSNNGQAQQPAPAGPQIILQQPIINQAPPMYEAQQRWAQPPLQGPPQWSQPPQGPPQWAPHPMGQQQQYSPNSGYDNAGFNQGTAPPAYNPGKY